MLEGEAALLTLFKVWIPNNPPRDFFLGTTRDEAAYPTAFGVILLNGRTRKGSSSEPSIELKKRNSTPLRMQ